MENPSGPTYSLPMGMGIMRVGQKALEVIHYHTYMLAIIIGIRVGFSSRHRMASTGPLV
ncbi:hypothetical protein IKG12_00670 [Candidatus Saccharibacteria bacterium]|nr:hypothetical protein [Candidatus Saccharibacteria bacterium]